MMKLNTYRPLKGLFILLFLVLTSCFSSKQDPKDIVVLKVNHTTLVAEEFAKRLSREVRQLNAVHVKDKILIDKSKRKVTNDFIIQVLTRDWAKQNNIKVLRDGESGWQIEVNKIRASYPDEISFRQALINEGLSLSEWQANVRFSLLQKLVIKQLNSEIKPPAESDIKIYYKNHKNAFTTPNRVKIRQIVLRAEAEAKSVRSELRKRKSKFSELAKKYSITPEGANGGLVGWVTQGVTDAFDQAFKMRKSRLSEVIKSPYGYHIIEVLDKKRQTTTSYNNAREKINMLLMEKREKAIYSGWLEDQIRSTKVFKNEELINNLIIETKGS